MKILTILVITVVLGGCVSDRPIDLGGKPTIKSKEADEFGSTKVEGVSFAKLNSKVVIVVANIKRTEILNASTKNDHVELIKVAKRAFRNKKGFKKVQSPSTQNNQNGDDAVVVGESENGITIVKNEQDWPILICHGTHNPCSVDNQLAIPSGGCGADFGEEPRSVGEFFDMNRDRIIDFCGEGGDGNET